VRSKPVAVTANKGVDIAGERIIINKKQAKWRLRHKGTDIAACYYHFSKASQQQWSTPTREGVGIAGEQIIIIKSKLNSGRATRA